MENTILLSNEEYGGIPFDLHDAIKKHVNIEAEKWHSHDPVPVLPVVLIRRQKPVPLSAGVYNMCRQFLP